MTEILIGIIIVLLAAAAVFLALRLQGLQRRLDDLPAAMTQGFEERHRAMLADLHNGLTQQGDRLGTALTDNSDRLRAMGERSLLLVQPYCFEAAAQGIMDASRAAHAFSDDYASVRRPV